MAGTLSRRSFVTAGLAAVAALPWHHRPNHTHGPTPSPSPEPEPSVGTYLAAYSHDY